METNLLNDSFKVKDIVQLKYFPESEAARKEIRLCQRKYIIDILNEIRMLASKSCTTPLMANNKIVFEASYKTQILKKTYWQTLTSHQHTTTYKFHCSSS